MTTKILAVALTTTAGCAPTVGAPAATSESARPEIVTVVVPVQSSAAPTSEPQAAAAQAEAPASAPTTEPAPPEPPSPGNDPRLLALKSELERAGRDVAMTRIGHFRPLCDKDGYPLVGNMTRKVPVYGPTAFCGELRSRSASR